MRWRLISVIQNSECRMQNAERRQCPQPSEFCILNSEF
jgi:hypothetical protein